jgi:hypothetical protein
MTNEDRQMPLASLNIPQRRRQDSSIASARPAAPMQSRDARSGAHACWHGGSASCHNTESRRRSDMFAGEPSRRRSSRILRIRDVAAA